MKEQTRHRVPGRRVLPSEVPFTGQLTEDRPAPPRAQSQHS